MEEGKISNQPEFELDTWYIPRKRFHWCLRNGQSQFSSTLLISFPVVAKRDRVFNIIVLEMATNKPEY